MDPLLLETLDFCSSTIGEFMSTKDAVGPFLARFQIRSQGELNTKIAQSSFTLDIVPFSVDEHVRVQDIFHRCSLRQLRILLPFNPSLFDSFARIIEVILWSTRTCHVLSGNAIDAWIQLLHAVFAPMLRRFVIKGTGPIRNRLLMQVLRLSGRKSRHAHCGNCGL